MSPKAMVANFKHRPTYLLVLVLVIVGLYLLITPIMPEVFYRWHKLQGFKQPSYATVSVSNADDKPSGLPKQNTLVIPAIGLNTSIIEGQSDSTVNKGVWRRPAGSDPSKTGNTIMVGHRFNYFGDGGQAFYNLDKVAVGDQVLIVWQQKVYKYTVTTKKIVEPTDLSVESNTKAKRLTLYTCTPLWTNKQRLVLIAEPVYKT